jgi:hypothetical protein
VEWTNRVQFGVGCGRDRTGQSHAVYAVDMDGKTFKQLVSGTEQQQPYLWIGFLVQNPSHFALDSIGRYNEPSMGGAQLSEATQLLCFWWRYDSLDIVITGSSHATAGVNPQKLGAYKAFNLGAVGADFPWQKSMINNYVLKHCQNIKVVISSLDIGYLGIPEGEFSWKTGFSQSKGYRYDSAHFFWKNGITSDFINIIKKIQPPQAPLDSAFLSSYSGYMPAPCGGWGGDTPPWAIYSEMDWKVTDSNYQKNFVTINTIADTLRSRGIHWIVVNFPVSPSYRNYPYYSYHGPLWQTAADVLQQMHSLETSNLFFHLYNANLDGNHDYGDENAWDFDHLCGTGADKFTLRLTALIDSVLKK